MFASFSNAPGVARTRFVLAFFCLVSLALCEGMSPFGTGAYAQTTPTVPTAARVDYDYDDLGRLIKVTYVRANADGTDVTYSYVYDDAGNRKQVGVDGVALPEVSIGEGWAMEGEIVRFPLFFSSPILEPVTIGWSVATGDDAWVDPTSGSRIIPVDSSGWFIEVPTKDNATKEGYRTITVTISIEDGDINLAPTGSSATGYIQDDDITYFTATDAPNHLEGTYEAITITQVRAATEEDGREIPVTAQLVNQTAVQSDDFDSQVYSFSNGNYTALPGNILKFAPGENAKTIYVKTADDLNYERTEFFFIDFTWTANDQDGNFDGWERSQIDIPNTDLPPTVSIIGGEVAEGQPITFTLAMTATSFEPVSVSLTTLDEVLGGLEGVPAEAGVDYDPTSIPATHTFLADGGSPIVETFDVATLVDGRSEVLAQHFHIDADLDEWTLGLAAASMSPTEFQASGSILADVSVTTIAEGDVTFGTATDPNTVYLVPAGRNVTVTLNGGAGGNATTGADGGKGGSGTFVFNTANDVYVRMRVGKQGGSKKKETSALRDENGGGAAGVDTDGNSRGGQGGGATSIIFSTDGMNWTAVAVAGGGGGASGGIDGAGGKGGGGGGGLGLSGQDGNGSSTNSGLGGTTSSAGAGVNGSGAGGGPGEDGEAKRAAISPAQGNAEFAIGGGGSGYSINRGSGGGGGGYYGGSGGRGYKGPGGGGSGKWSAGTASSIVGGTVTLVDATTGANGGDGSITFGSASQHIVQSANMVTVYKDPGNGADATIYESYNDGAVSVTDFLSDGLDHGLVLQSATLVSGTALSFSFDSTDIQMTTQYCGQFGVDFIAEDVPLDGSAVQTLSGYIVINVEASISNPAAPCTSLPEPAGPVVSIGNAVGSNGVAVTEGDGSDLVYTVTLSEPVNEPVSFNWAVKFGSNLTGAYRPADPEDISGANSGILTFAANDTTPKAITIGVVDDALIEPWTDVVSIELTNLSTSAASFGDNLGSGYILDNDGYGVSLDIVNTNNVVEGDGRSFEVAIELNRPADEILDVPWIISGLGNNNFVGVSGSDYTVDAAYTSPIRFEVGDQRKTISIGVNDDGVNETTELLTLQLDLVYPHSTFFSGGAQSVDLTISDNDSANTAPNAQNVTVNKTWPTNGDMFYDQTITFLNQLTNPDAEGHALDLSEVTVYPGYYVPKGISIVAGTNNIRLETNKCGVHRFLYTIYDLPDGTNRGLADTAELTINVDEANVGDCTGRWIDPTQYSTPDLPDVSVSDAASVEEGGVLVFDVTLSQATTVPITVDWTATGIDVDSSDVDALSGQIFFDVGSTGEKVRISATDDLLDEADEVVTVSLDQSSGLLNWVDPTASGTIIDNDAPAGPQFAISAVTLTATEGTAETLSFDVALSPAATVGSSVTWTVSGDGADLITSPTTGTLNFAAGGLPQTVALTVGDNAVYEGDQAVVVTLSNALPIADVSVGPASEINLTVVEDEAAPPDLPVATISGAGSITEGGVLDFPVTLSAVPTGTATVAWSVSGVGASALDSPTSGTLSISGTSSGTISVDTKDNTSVDGSRTVTVTLSSPSGMALGTPNSANGTINDDDTNAVFSVSKVSNATEGGNLKFQITLTGSTGQSGNITYYTSSGTAGGSDYTAIGDTTVSVSVGSPKTINVSTVSGDGWENRNETVHLTIKDATGDTTIGTNSATATINDGDSAPTLNYWFAAASKSESATGFTVYISKNGKSQVSHSITLKAENVSAIAGSDYVGFHKTFTFAAGADYQEKTDLVQIKDDTVCAESDTETFLLNASGATGGATLSNTSKSLSIIDDDNCVPNALNYSVAVGSLGVGKSVTVRKVDSDADDSKSSLTIGKPSDIAGTLYFTVSGDAILVEAHQCGTWNKSYTLTDPGGASDSGTLSIDVPQSLCDGGGGQPL